MFKRVTINLAGPICSCDEQDISWGIWNNDKGNPGLVLTCKKCETQLKVPNGKFVANFNFDVPYPGNKKKEEAKKEVKKEEKKKVNITDPDGSNVIPFPKQDGRDKDKND